MLFFLANLWEKIKSSEFLGGDFTVLSLLFLWFFFTLKSKESGVFLSYAVPHCLKYFKFVRTCTKFSIFFFAFQTILNEN